MVKNAKIDFDTENDILYLYMGDKVKDSLQIENFVLDFSSDNKIVAIEIMDASRILSELSENDITKDALSRIESAVLQNTLTSDKRSYSALQSPIKYNKDIDPIKNKMG